ncbi:MAG: asparagine synthase-related protein [Pseudomonadota bacterium]|nr:asparagine synthase-related protein [Pseudomonadota bacterium]
MRSLGGASFGISLFETLPEDRHDFQPISDDGHLLVADIRLDNRDNLIAWLGINRADAAARSDADIFGLCWLREGDQCLARIVGDYALAVYAADEGRLTLARDFTGQRPLFYSTNGAALSFASLPSGLLASSDNWRGFDLDRVAAMLAGERPQGDGTYYQGIARVLPGHMVTFQAGEYRSQKIWTPSFAPLSLPSDDDYVEAFRETLDTAVRSRLRRIDGPIAAHLSAGYDSAAVAATAARLIEPEGRVLALTSAPRLGFVGPVPRGRFADESGLAALTATRHHMDHLVVRSAGQALDRLVGQTRFYQDPARNIINSGWASKVEELAAQRGGRVLLSGELGNLTLNAGNLVVLGDLVGRGQLAAWWREARLAARRPDVRWRGILVNSFDGWLPRTATRALQRMFLGAPDGARMTFLQDKWLPQLRPRPSSGEDRRAGGNSYRSRFEALKQMDYGTFRKGALAESGVDTRDPTADRRLIEFSLSLPPEQLFSGGVSRPLARRALADRLPREIIEEPHRGYQSADWFERFTPADARVMAEEIKASPTARLLIDFDKIDRAIAEWPTADFHRFDIIARYVNQLPLTLAAGYFFLEVERATAGHRAADRR